MESAGSQPIVEYCQAKAASCNCSLVIGHNSPHLCGCESSWIGEWNDDTFQVVEFPAPNDPILNFLAPLPKKPYDWLK